ncbi:MAG: hypothetical protein ACRELE_01580, partial [Gemmatimonadales bacterium]
HSSGRRPLPGLATRAVVMLAAAFIVSALALGAVDLVTGRAAGDASPAASDRARSDNHHREPELGAGLGELGIQLLLVIGIAVAGRKILRIRL